MDNETYMLAFKNVYNIFNNDATLKQTIENYNMPALNLYSIFIDDSEYLNSKIKKDIELMNDTHGSIPMTKQEIEKEFRSMRRNDFEQPKGLKKLHKRITVYVTCFQKMKDNPNQVEEFIASMHEHHGDYIYTYIGNNSFDTDQRVSDIAEYFE